jgi:excisionase family DNA binding protein
MSAKRLDGPVNLAGYLRVGDAARLVGVSRATLRNWDKTGKLRAVRHPMNGYRLYRRKDLESIPKGLR